jgi:hypothetical protein
MRASVGVATALAVFAATVAAPAQARIFIQHDPVDNNVPTYTNQILGYLTALLHGDGTVALAGPQIAPAQTVTGISSYPESGSVFSEVIYTPPQHGGVNHPGAVLIQRVAAHPNAVIIRRHSGWTMTPAPKQLSCREATPEATAKFVQVLGLNLGHPAANSRSMGIGIPADNQWAGSQLMGYRVLVQNTANHSLASQSFQGIEAVMLGHELIHADRMWLGDMTQRNQQEDNFKASVTALKAVGGTQPVDITEKQTWMEVAVVGIPGARATDQKTAANYPCVSAGQLNNHRCVTENDLRRDLGAPIRLRYTSVAGPGVQTDNQLLKRLGAYGINAF